MENGTWVVKNAGGQVTATYDSAKNEWTYNYENIKMQVGIAKTKFVNGMVGTIGKDSSFTIPADMLKPLSPD